MASYRISFQLYSARNFPPVAEQLEALAAIGYDAVEPYGGLIGDDVESFRRQLTVLGLACPTAHLPLALLDDDRPRAIAVAQSLGLETVVVPSIGAAERPSDIAGWDALGRRLGEHADALSAAGLMLAWHNHAFEYDTLADGSRPIDHIVGAAGVFFEADIGWIVRAGRDTAEEIGRFPGKIAAFHIKDVAADGVTDDDGWTDVGAGTIDWQALWPAIASAGTDLLVVEHDNPSDWKAFAAHSFDFLTDLAGEDKA